MAQYFLAIAPEITTKSSRTRHRFMRRLVGNLRDALEAGGFDARIDDRWSRLHVDVPNDDGPASECLSRVFGVHAVARVAAKVPADLSEIVGTGERLFADRVRDRTFAVRARRGGARYPFRSRDVEVQLGAALDRYGRVDLTHPDVTVHVEVRDGEAILHAGAAAAAGGLPLGVEGRAVALLSGGFDSPVASWLMLRRGIALDYVFCNLGGEAYERSVVGVAKVLADGWSYGTRPRLHVVPFEGPVAELERAVPDRWRQVLLKRLMYRAAMGVVRETDGLAIVTGESVGQVSSQTLANLCAIEDVSPFPLLRPLVGFGKNEIIRRAEHIGTAVLSARIREYCALVTHRPVTDASAAAARAREARVDLAVLDRALAARKVLDLRGMRDEDLAAPYLFADEIAQGAAVIDCRPADAFAAWHYPGAVRWDPPVLAARFRELDKATTFVLYCGAGVQSAHLAELMQEAGYEAYSFKGGVVGLQRWAVGRTVPKLSGTAS